MDFVPIGGKEVESGSVLSYLRNDMNGFEAPVVASAAFVEGP